MVFLKIHLSIFVAAAVVNAVLFQRTWSEFYKGCNSVRLSEEAQDNIRTRVAAEKKPYTLEKDKEDQNIM